MAKKYTSRDWISKALSQGKTVKQIAAKIGRSPSTVRAVATGKRPGKNLLPALKAIAQKRKVPSLPSSPGREVKAKAPALTPLQIAQQRLAGFDPGTKVVISVTTKTGRSIMLGRHGGIDVDSIGSVGGFVSGQAARQSYGIDDSEIFDIDFEDFEDWSE
jgi:transcriptional regulator with XRE-family HTH domain